MARPTKYNTKFHPKIAQLAASKGLTDKEIAKECGISEVTLNAWKKKYPKFLKSIRAGKKDPNEMVEAVLYKKCLGFEDPKAVKIMQYQGKPVIVPYKKRFEPCFNSIRLFLMNRMPEKYRDKPEVNVPVNITIQLPDDMKDDDD